MRRGDSFHLEPSKAPPTRPFAEGVSERIAFARTLAVEASKRTLRWFPGPVAWMNSQDAVGSGRENAPSLELVPKSDGSPVTAADRDAEMFLRERLGESFPHDALLGEEFGAQVGSTRFRWVVDPIDGTVSFVHGVPLYGTILGLEMDGSPVAGVVVLPAMDEVIWGGPGLGAWHEVGTVSGGQARVSPARVSSTPRLREATVAITSLDYCVQAGMPELYARVQKSCAVTRGWSDCYAFVLAATGRVDAVVEPVMKPWDIAGIMPIIEAAGGTCTDFQGERRIDTGASAMSNGPLHEELLRTIGGR